MDYEQSKSSKVKTDWIIIYSWEYQESCTKYIMSIIIELIDSIFLEYLLLLANNRYFTLEADDWLPWSIYRKSTLSPLNTRESHGHCWQHCNCNPERYTSCFYRNTRTHTLSLSLHLSLSTLNTSTQVKYDVYAQDDDQDFQNKQCWTSTWTCPIQEAIRL